ncbi:hypothetical protein Goari_003511, partial [Gossypium aridum]|nr:hypothetical protein [Gossypium aridum]
MILDFTCIKNALSYLLKPITFPIAAILFSYNLIVIISLAKYALKPNIEGLVYCCSICKFVLHIECVSPPPFIEDPSTHEHPFTRCLRELSFNCDVCGTLGNYVSYNCSTCSLMVHKKCISLPRFIKSLWHDHPISHKYFVVDNECTTHDCLLCHEEVNMACGSYNCSKCKFIIHVNCALEDAL